MSFQKIVLKLVHLRFFICECHFEQIFLGRGCLFPDSGLRKLFLLASDIILQLSDLVLAEVNLPLEFVELVFDLVLHLEEVSEWDRRDLPLFVRFRPV